MFLNGGYAKGYNNALQSIEADIYCLINSDVAVTKNWLPPILEVFKKEKNTAIIQPKILDLKIKRNLNMLVLVVVLSIFLGIHIVEDEFLII